MRCNKCGAELLKSDFCPECQADVTFYKRAAAVSNVYYNKGLEQAGVRDLSGAIESLKMSVLLDKTNIAARNLLGLCYFESGEVVEALSHWVVSKNFRTVGNPAADYVAEVQSKKTDFDEKAAAARKFNKVLENASNENYDMALIQLKKIVSQCPGFLKGQLLLALFYMEKKAYARAERALRNVLKVDTGNSMARRYLKSIPKNSRESSEKTVGNIPSFLKDDQKSAEGAQRGPLSGNDVIIPKSEKRMAGSGAFSLLNILIGLGIGAALVFFLVMPARDRLVANGYEETLQNNAKEITETGDKLAAAEKKVEELTKTNDELQKQIDGGEDGDVTKLLSAVNQYMSGDSEGGAMTLAGIKNSSSLQGDAKDVYGQLKEQLGDVSSEGVFEEAMAAFNNSEVRRASTLFESAYEVDENNEAAAYYAGRCYQSMQDTDKANKYFKIITEKFGDGEYAQEAQEYLSANGA